VAATITRPLGQHFIFKSAIITSDRASGDPRVDNIDISPIIAELKVFESLTKPYLTGELLVVDQSELFRSLRIKGSERITIVLDPGHNNKLEQISRTFLIRGIKLVQNNDTFVVDLIEESGYIASTTVISKSYTGRTVDTISKICKGYLNKDIDVMYKDLDSVRDTTHVVIPYWNTLQSLTWLLDRTTTSTGNPYFLTASIYRPNLILFNVDAALQAQPFNLEQPFVRGDRYNQVTGSADFDGTAATDTAINRHLEKTTDSMHALAKAGALAMNYQLICTESNLVDQITHNAFNLLQEMKEKEVMFNQDIVDPLFQVNDGIAVLQPSENIHQVCSSYTYLPAQSYGEDKTRAEQLAKLNNKIMKNMMIQKTLTVDVPGKNVGAHKAAVGQRIRLEFLTGERVKNKNTAKKDEKLTGNYIMTNIIHRYSNTEYNCTIDCVKLNREEYIDV